MAFTPIAYDSGKVAIVQLSSGEVVAKGDCLIDAGNGYYQRAGSSTNLVRYVALEGKTSIGSTEINVVHTLGVLFIADTNADPARTDVGTTADLTDYDTLNQSSSTSDVFFIEAIEGAVTDRKVRGYFLTDKAS